MDLPSYGQIDQINERLLLLQQEVKQMDHDYGFTKEFNNEQNNLDKQKSIVEITGSSFDLKKDAQKIKRYKQLPQINVTKQQKMSQSPQISQKWKELFSEKPQQQAHYEQRLQPVLRDDSDFQLDFQPELLCQGSKQYHTMIANQY